MSEQAPPGVDISVPSPARIYDVFLGGKDNFAVDRAAAKVATDAGPDIPRAARENRAYLGRAVRFALDRGIRQFLDIGTGLPTQNNVHEVVESVVPDGRVIYVDNDPIVLIHARALLPPSENVAVIKGDLRAPKEILADPVTTSLIDFDQPVAVLMLAVLHFVEDDEARDAIAEFRERMAPGSLLIVSHSTVEGHPETGQQATGAWRNATSRIHSRTRAEVTTLLDAFEPVEPGVVWVPEWRNPDENAAVHGTRWMYAAVSTRP